jgi:predicted nucleic-acid-binding protein
MIALDTNVVVRVITQDHPGQARAASAVMEEVDFLLTKTVVTEVVWVLTGLYARDRDVIVRSMKAVLGLENCVCEDRAIVLQAIAWFEEGLDFSDAMHLASARDATLFATFDQRFAKAALRLEATPSVRLLRDRGPSLVNEAAAQYDPGGKVSRRRVRAGAKAL